MTDEEIVRAVLPYTMTGIERVAAAIRAVDTVVDGVIEGDVVECGVWRGGSMMAMALALLRRGDTARTLYLYDTYSGMTAPDDADVQHDGVRASRLLATSPREAHVWAVASLGETTRNVLSTGYPPERIRFVVGPVEATIPGKVPESIAILRLDTDWYASTRHELVHLYPRLSTGGILIVDDYGHWRGSRRATDEYFATLENAPPLRGIDYTGVLAVKPASCSTTAVSTSSSELAPSLPRRYSA